MDAALWIDLTYISPNRPFYQGQFGSRNILQMILEVLLRIALACGSNVWLHPHVCSVGFPHVQMGSGGANEDRTFWRGRMVRDLLDSIINNRRGEGPLNLLGERLATSFDTHPLSSIMRIQELRQA